MRSAKVLALLIAALALLAAGCGGDDDDGDNGDGAAQEEEISGNVSIMGVWTGEEAASFEAVLDGFAEQQPDVTVNYNPVGDEIPTVLATRVEGGNPPDVATAPQPGLVSDFHDQGVLQSLDFAAEEIESNFTEGAYDFATFDGEIFGFLFKAANKSTVWYNVALFEQAGVEPPETFEDFLEVAQTLRASGTQAYSIGADVGWPLTDIFENIYLRQAGPEMYDQLADGEIPWDDQSVKDALETMAEIVGDTDNLVGGTSGAVQTDFPTSVQNAFKEDPDAAMVLEGDFVGGEILASTPSQPVEDFDVFDFPSVEGSEPMVVGGGDTMIMFNDTPAAQALIRYLATPEAAEIWAERGGFSSANRNIDTGVFPDEISERTATALAEAEVFRFDLSDLQPAAFGATVGQGLWQEFIEFLRNPDDVDGAAERMQQEAERRGPGS
ncbi:MAG TPA: extracellular solute-binding protein [Solirubrobacterales bacterium]|nr:extracellular solute-binding protein [Solirubrobacterales bacterium]